MSIGIDDIRAAAARIAGEVVRTPCNRSRTLSAITGADIHLKFENLQFTASFKERGALNKLLQLSKTEAEAGVIAMSAGNHAQAVAYHAHRLGIAATIVMPVPTPFTKIRNTQALGARVELYGESLSEAAAHAHDLAGQGGLTFIHPYDDPDIIAGQGTATLELLQDFPDIDMLVVAIGGGGLISGAAIAAKALRPEIEIIGVEAALYPSMYQTLRGQPVTAHGLTLAEGIAVKQPGKITREIITSMVADILLVDEAALERAVLAMAEIEKSVAEGAGAAPLAAVLSQPERFRGRRVGLIIGGGNIDSRILSQVLMRGLLRSGRMARLRAEIPDQPGALAQVTALIAEAGANILEVGHQRWFYDVPVKLTEVDFLLEMADPATIETILGALRDAGIKARELAAASGDAAKPPA